MESAPAAVLWIETVPVILVALAVLIVPGGAVAALLGLRGMWLAAVAAPLSVSLIVVTSLVAPFIGVGWGWIPVAVLTLIACVAAWLWRRFLPAPRRPLRTSARSWTTAVAVAVPAVVIAFVLVRSIGEPEYISQRFDNYFHLNAVQYVIDTANASPLWVGTMTSPAGLPFYPSGWHALVSLVVLLCGASVAVATNAVIIVVAAIVWPLSAVLLAGRIVGRSRPAILAAGALSAGFAAFPYLPLHYGTLYPLFLGLAVAPALIAVVVETLRPGRRIPLLGALLVLLLTPGVSVAHPGAILAVLALTLPFVIAVLVIGMRRASPRGVLLRAIGLAAYLVVGVVTLQVVRPPASQIYWPVIETVPQAIGSVVSSAVYQYPAAPVVALLALVGAYRVIRRGTYLRWAALGMAVIGSVLYVIVAASTSETLRLWLTAPWYNNAPRLASIWVLSVLPLVTIGAVYVARRIMRLLGARSRSALGRAGLAAGAVAAVGLVVVVQYGAISQAAADIEYTYELREGGPILSPDEFALMQELPELVPDGERIAANPWTGASFAYGVSGVPVLMPHLLMDETPPAHVINTELATRGDSPEVCEALRETGVRYVLDFDADGDFQDNTGDYSGLVDLGDTPYVTLAAQEGDAKLWKIVSCGLST
jgi:hypothetical protein